MAAQAGLDQDPSRETIVESQTHLLRQAHLCVVPVPETNGRLLVVVQMLLYVFYLRDAP